MGAAARTTRLLVTGGTGFVGGHFCPRLRAQWPDAERLLLTRAGDPVAREGFTTQALDLTDRASVEATVARFRPDMIVHLAAQSSIGTPAGGEETWRINLEATLNLAGAVARHVPAATFFFVSSAEIYGRAFNAGTATEDSVPQPMNAYARSKLAAEMVLADTLPTSAALIIARAFNHTGPGQDTRFVLPAFAAQIAAIEAGRIAPRLMVGNLDAERDFLDVRDVCDAYLALLCNAEVGCRQTVNVASGAGRRIGDLLGELQSLSNVAFDIGTDPDRMRPSEIARSVGSHDRLTQATGWAAKTPLRTTLRDVLDDQRGRAVSRLAS